MAKRGPLTPLSKRNVRAFCTVEQRDVVAAGTIRNCWFFQRKESSLVISTVISPDLEVSEPISGVEAGRCAGKIPPPGVPQSGPARSYPGRCHSVGHAARIRGGETSPVHLFCQRNITLYNSCCELSPKRAWAPREYPRLGGNSP